MIRIAFLGSDSTHTEAFGKQFNLPGGQYHGIAKVTSIWGENAEQTAAKAKALEIDRVAASIDEALRDVDFAMVIGRFGDTHFEPARQALERGLPTFVDKPFTLSLAQAETLAQLARSKRAKLCSSSPLRFAPELDRLQGAASTRLSVTVAAPATCTDLGADPRLQSVFFYGIHAIEMLLEVVGHDVHDVQIQAGRTTITLSFETASGTAGARFVRGADEFYEMSIYAVNGVHQATVALDGGYYPRLLKFLIEEFLTGRKTIPLESSVQAIRLLAEIERADRAGGQ